jgi:hypothetical protein
VKYGLIAGNGRFPLLALQTARSLGHEVVVIGIEEEASKEIEAFASRCYWISLGQLSRLIDILKREGIAEDDDDRTGQTHQNLLGDPARLASRETPLLTA